MPCSGKLFNHQDGVDTAEGEILNGRCFNRMLHDFLHMPDHRAAFVNFFQVQGWGNKTVLHHIERHDGFDGAAGGHSMAGIAF